MASDHGSSVPSLQALALVVVAAHVRAHLHLVKDRAHLHSECTAQVEYESSLDYCLPIGGSVELLETMRRQGRLRGDTLRPLLHASPDELAPVLGSRLALAAAGCPALRDVAVQRLSCSVAERLPDGYRTGSRAVARMLAESTGVGPIAGKPECVPCGSAARDARTSR